MAKVYQLKITLNGTKPPIWRKVKVNSNITFEKLHEIIQTVMGWEFAHLYKFNTKAGIIGQIYEDDWEEDFHLTDATKKQINEVLKRKGSKTMYIYDFGDSWEHTISVEQTFTDEKLLHPTCIGGERACPPEDCGGIWGYTDMLEILKDQKHPEYEELTEWLGGKFNPELFNITKVNNKLKRLK